MELTAENGFGIRLEAIVKTELCSLLAVFAHKKGVEEAAQARELHELEMAAEVEFQIENQKTFGGWA